MSPKLLIGFFVAPRSQGLGRQFSAPLLGPRKPKAGGVRAGLAFPNRRYAIDVPGGQQGVTHSYKTLFDTT